MINNIFTFKEIIYQKLLSLSSYFTNTLPQDAPVISDKTITKDTPVYDEGVNATKQIYVSDSNTLIDISNYSKMYKSSGGGANGEITFYRENEEVKANLAELIKEAIKSENAEEYISGHRLVKIDDEKDLYIMTLYVSYDEEVRYTSVDAYILYK